MAVDSGEDPAMALSLDEALWDSRANGGGDVVRTWTRTAAPMTYKVKLKLIGAAVRPEWAPGKAINPERPQGSYVGVASVVEEISDWLKQWGRLVDCWSERLR
jgi:hypothetical protein